MGVKKYTCKQGPFWRIDTWVVLPDGRGQRIQKRKIPTREQAVALEAKIRAEAFEGRFFERLRVPKVTVGQLWKEWEPISRRDKDSWRSDIARARYLCAILGDRIASQLTQRDVDEYRNLLALARNRGNLNLPVRTASSAAALPWPPSSTPPRACGSSRPRC